MIGQENGDKIMSASKSGDSKVQEDAVRSSFSALMRQEKDVIQRELKKLVDRVKSIGKYKNSYICVSCHLDLSQEFQNI